MDENNRNLLLAIVLSGLVLVLWQVFYAGPQMEKERLRRQQAKQFEASKLAHKTGVASRDGKVASGAGAGGPGAQADNGSPLRAPEAGAGAGELQSPAGSNNAPATPGLLAGPAEAREKVLARSPRYLIDTPSLKGSIALKGGRIDDLVLRKYHISADKKSPKVILFSPSGSAHPYYAEYGWLAPRGSGIRVPGPDSMWKAEGNGRLAPGHPVTLVWDNGQGLIFRRVISIDDKYMFNIHQLVENHSGKAVTLYPYALVSRHEMPKTRGYYILHEGLVGVLGEDGLQEIKYKQMLKDKVKSFKNRQQGWLGITDKYWAATVIPDQSYKYEAHFSARQYGRRPHFQADYQLGAVNIAPGKQGEARGMMFAGAKKVDIIDGYTDKLKIKQFDLLIDWGWFYFITKPMFAALHFFYGLVGNFGVAILLVTVLVKLLFYPLANKSYESMSKMKQIQPKVQKIKERFGDDKVRQQQEMMELYKKAGVNPLAGCLPMLIQIPVFFSLYKVLFTTLEMRHAPFFGWIHDLSAPDPTSHWNLFGLLPYQPPHFLSLGVWPLLMGITMWIQMKLNPQQGDRTQQAIFNWMPVVFTFMLASFPAGLVIYWTWNNLLSFLQQWWIMKKNGVKVDLLENTGLKKLLARIGQAKS